MWSGEAVVPSAGASRLNGVELSRGWTFGELDGVFITGRDGQLCNSAREDRTRVGLEALADDDEAELVEPTDIVRNEITALHPGL